MLIVGALRQNGEGCKLGYLLAMAKMRDRWKASSRANF
jgi:hypothetical protein